MALALNNLKRVDMPLNKKTETDQILENKNRKENNRMGISNDELAKSHTGWLQIDYERDTLRGKLNLF